MDCRESSSSPLGAFQKRVDGGLRESGLWRWRGWNRLEVSVGRNDWPCSALWPSCMVYLTVSLSNLKPLIGSSQGLEWWSTPTRCLIKVE